MRYQLPFIVSKYTWYCPLLKGLHPMEEKQERSLSDACPLWQNVFKMAAIEPAPHFAPKVKILGDVRLVTLGFTFLVTVRSDKSVIRTGTPMTIPSKFGSNWQSSFKRKRIFFFYDYLHKYALFLELTKE